MPAKLVDLVIIDPSLGDDTGPLWDVGENAWTSVDASDTLRTLMVQNRKFAGVFKVVMYSNMEQVSTFTRAFVDATAKDVHHVPITRIGPDFKPASNTLAIVGTFSTTRGTSVTALRGMTPSNGLKVYLPPSDADKSVFGRHDISGCSIGPQQVGYSRRCVDEYRYLVREYSNKGNWVMCLHTVDGSGMLAALLEGRSVVGLESVPQRLGVATWRLKRFHATEKVLLKYHAAMQEAGYDARAKNLVHKLVEDDMEELSSLMPAKPSDDMLGRVWDELKGLRKDHSGSKLFPTMTDEEFKTIGGRRVERCTDIATAQAFIDEPSALLITIGKMMKQMKSMAEGE